MICSEYSKEMEKGSLVVHHQTKNSVKKGRLGKEGDEEARGEDTRTYRMAFPAKAVPRPCPVEGFSGRALTQMAMRMHFWHRHVRDNATSPTHDDLYVTCWCRGGH